MHIISFECIKIYILLTDFRSIIIIGSVFLLHAAQQTPYVEPALNRKITTSEFIRI